MIARMILIVIAYETGRKDGYTRGYLNGARYAANRMLAAMAEKDTGSEYPCT